MAEKLNCPFCEAVLTLKSMRDGRCACGAIIEENSAGEVCFYPPEDSFSKGSDEQKGIDISINSNVTDENTAVTTAVDNKKTESAGANAPKTLSELCAEQGLTLEGTTVKKCNKNAISVVIPEGVTKIGGKAFYECKALKSIEIPEGVTSIGDDAFVRCGALISINIPGSVATVGAHAFYDCKSLKSIVISEGVKSIGDSAFCYCSSLESINIPASVTSIGGGTFAACSSLTSVTISESVTSIGGWAFEDCKALTGIVIPESVTTVDKDVFKLCSPKLVITVKGDKERTKSWHKDWNIREGDGLFAKRHKVKYEK